MKMAKTLLLGTAAGFVATFASAADLPRKSAAPVEYVRVCSAQGAGFFTIPGSDTCLKIGGEVRMDVVTNAHGYVGANTHNFHSRAVLNFDSRSASSMGTVRSFTQFHMRRGTATSSSPDATIGSGNYQTNRSTLVVMEQAFVQFAGITAGLAPSPFAFGGNAGSIAIVANAVSGGYLQFGNAQTQLSYTAAFGGGLSATVGIVDSQFTRSQQLATATLGVITLPAATDNLAYGGNIVPDIAGNINFTQAWGSAQLSGVVKHIRAAGAANLATWGYAVGAGVRLNVPSIGAGSHVYFNGAYGSGANSYIFDNGGSDGLSIDRSSFSLRPGFTANYSDGALNATFDGINKTTSWALHTGLRAVFNPMWQAGLFAGMLNVDSPTVNGTGTNLSDFRLWNVGANVTYSPVRNLNLSLEGIYYSGKTNNAIAAPLAATEVNLGVFAAGVRVQRVF